MFRREQFADKGSRRGHGCRPDPANDLDAVPDGSSKLPVLVTGGTSASAVGGSFPIPVVLGNHHRGFETIGDALTRDLHADRAVIQGAGRAVRMVGAGAAAVVES